MILPPRPPSTLAALVLGLVLAAGCSSPEAENANAKSPGSGPEKRDTSIVHEPCDIGSTDAVKVDVNGDGRPDIIHVMKGGKEVCRAVDLNMDGKMDVFIYYDDQGRERRRESDFDRDGRCDEIAIYENGQLKLKLRETNFDDKIDTWDYYEGGRLVRRERDSDGDGIVDQWWTFNNPANPKCAVVAVDRNADGKPDPESVVDLCGESYGAPAKAPAPGAPPAASAAPSAAPAAPPATPVAAPPVPPPSASAVAPAPPAPPKQPPKK
jgi:hypothetical protein